GIRRNKYCIARREDAFFATHPDSKLARDHVDHLLLRMFVRLGSSSSSEAVAPDFDLRAFDRRAFGRGVLRADSGPLHLAPVIEWHNFSFSPTRVRFPHRNCREPSVCDGCSAMTRTGGNLLWRPQKGNVVFHTLCKRVQTLDPPGELAYIAPTTRLCRNSLGAFRHAQGEGVSGSFHDQGGLRHSLGREEEMPAKRAAKPIGLAIVGAGRIGLIRAEIAVKHPNVGWIGFAEIRTDRGNEVAERVRA